MIIYSKIKKFLVSVVPLIKYSFVGVTNVVISLSCYSALIYFFHFHYLFANVIAYLCGVMNSYILNKKWVFTSSKANSRSFPKFLFVNIGNFIINTILLAFLIESLSLSSLAAQPLTIFITTIIGFLATKVWVFSDKSDARKQSKDI